MDKPQLRIALCLTGLIGGLRGRNGVGKAIDPINGHHWYNKNLLQKNNVDIFFHTWSNSKNDLVSIYKPKKYLIERQDNFSEINSQFYGFDSYESFYKKENKLNESYVCSDKEITNFKNLIFRSHSKWTSTYKVIKLKIEYEQENDFKYDFVIISRFDIALKKRINFSNLEKQILYLSERNENQKGRDRAFNDLIFMGGSSVVELFSELIKNIQNYSVDPIYACYDHIKSKEIKWASYFRYGKDTFILRWNQHLMTKSPEIYYYIKHNLREIKRKVFNV